MCWGGGDVIVRQSNFLTKISAPHPKYPGSSLALLAIIKVVFQKDIAEEGKVAREEEWRKINSYSVASHIVMVGVVILIAFSNERVLLNELRDFLLVFQHFSILNQSE